jgi:hypothetical protein
MSYDDDRIDLSDNGYIKLVRYQIVFTRCGYEAIRPLNSDLTEKIETITGDTTADAFKAEKKAQYLALSKTSC